MNDAFLRVPFVHPKRIPTMKAPTLDLDASLAGKQPSNRLL